MALSASFSSEFAPGLRDIIGTERTSMPAEYSMLFRQETSERQYEDYLHATGLPQAVQRDEGEATPFFDPIEGEQKRFTHNGWSIGFQVSTEAWDDDLYKTKSALRAAAAGLPESMRERVENEHVDVFVNGFSSYAPVQHPSSGSLWETTHERLDGGTAQSNLGTAAAMSTTSIRELEILFSKWFNDRGIRMKGSPDMLVYAPDNRYKVMEIFGPDRAAVYDDNTIGEVTGTPAASVAATTITNYSPGLKHFEYSYLDGLADNSYYILGRKHTLITLWRERPTMDSYDDLNTRTAKFASHMRFSFGPVSWFDTAANAGL